MEIDGIEEVKIDLVFDPPWTPDKMNEEAKSASAGTKSPPNKRHTKTAPIKHRAVFDLRFLHV